MTAFGRSRVTEVTDANRTQHAADCIRDAICGIDWSGEDHPALTNAWAALNSALEALGEAPMNDAADLDLWRYHGQVFSNG